MFHPSLQLLSFIRDYFLVEDKGGGGGGGGVLFRVGPGAFLMPS